MNFGSIKNKAYTHSTGQFTIYFLVSKAYVDFTISPLKLEDGSKLPDKIYLDSVSYDE